MMTRFQDLDNGARFSFPSSDLLYIKLGPQAYGALKHDPSVRPIRLFDTDVYMIHKLMVSHVSQSVVTRLSPEERDIAMEQRQTWLEEAGRTSK